MFTDEPVTPLKLEIIVDFVRRNMSTKLTRKMLSELMQPEPIVGEDSDRSQSVKTLKAAIELGLVTETDDSVHSAIEESESRSTRQLVLEALDKKVLSETSIEPYFAPFYSFLLGLNELGTVPKPRGEWALEFRRRVQGDLDGSNPFNSTKESGVHRWYAYCGLGWYDPNDVFQPNPYYRLKRALPKIFGDQGSALDSHEFMKRLANICPELDTGEIYIEATKSIEVTKERCSLGLSHALYDLHTDGLIQLNCPADARGWDISRAQPAFGGHIGSNRIASIKYLGK